MAHSSTRETKSNVDKQGVHTTSKEYEQRNFNLIIDGVPYFVKSFPFSYNDELRFRVIINNDTEHVFTWDSQVKMLRAIDDDASMIPDHLEEAISEKLQGQFK